MIEINEMISKYKCQIMILSGNNFEVFNFWWKLKVKLFWQKKNYSGTTLGWKSEIIAIYQFSFAWKNPGCHEYYS